MPSAPSWFRRNRFFLGATLAAASSIYLVACESSSGYGVSTFALTGDYVDTTNGDLYSFTYTSVDRYVGSTKYLYAVSRVDNQQGYLIVRNDAIYATNPQLYTRFEVFQDGDDIYWCLVLENAQSAEAALIHTPQQHVVSTGCLGQPWHLLKEVVDGGAPGSAGSAGNGGSAGTGAGSDAGGSAGSSDAGDAG